MAALTQRLVSLSTVAQVAGTPGGLMPYDSLLLPLPAGLRLAIARGHAREWEGVAPIIPPLPPPAAPPLQPGAPSPVGGAPLPPAAVGFRLRSPLRVGYLSFDFRDHPMGHLTLGLLDAHRDRLRHLLSLGPAATIASPQLATGGGRGGRAAAAMGVAALCLSYGPDDRSFFRNRFATAACAAFVDAREMRDGGGGGSGGGGVANVAAGWAGREFYFPATAGAAAGGQGGDGDGGGREGEGVAGIHVLVDLMGHTRGARLGIVAARPAPVSIRSVVGWCQPRVAGAPLSGSLRLLARLSRVCYTAPVIFALFVLHSCSISFLGYPGTMGAAFTDFALADAKVSRRKGTLVGRPACLLAAERSTCVPSAGGPERRSNWGLRRCVGTRRRTRDSLLA